MLRMVLIPLDGSRESENIIPLISGELASDTEVILIKVVASNKTQIIGDRVYLGDQKDEADWKIRTWPTS